MKYKKDEEKMTINPFEIKEKRKDKGHTQEDLAAILDIERSYLSRIERGEVEPSIELKKKLIEILGISTREKLEEVIQRYDESPHLIYENIEYKREYEEAKELLEKFEDVLLEEKRKDRLHAIDYYSYIDKNKIDFGFEEYTSEELSDERLLLYKKEENKFISIKFIGKLNKIEHISYMLSEINEINKKYKKSKNQITEGLFLVYHPIDAEVKLFINAIPSISVKKVKVECSITKLKLRKLI